MVCSGLLILCIASYIKVRDEHTRKDGWLALGGVAQYVPYPFDMAPFGQRLPDNHPLAKMVVLRRCAPLVRYPYCTARLRRNNASLLFTHFGGTLTMAETKEEQQELRELIRPFTKAGYWLALSDTETEGHWKWDNGAQLQVPK